MMRMKQVERINLMEERMERVAEAVKRLSAALEVYTKAQNAYAEALEAYGEVQEDLNALETYYGSEDWKRDFAADEAGKLPKKLKRGVLSEDGIWNLLDENQKVREKLGNLI